MPAARAREVPEEEALPEVHTLVIGPLKDGRMGLVWLTSHGRKVLERELLDVGDEPQMDNAWREEAYHRVWRQAGDPSAQSRLETARRVAPATGNDLVAGRGYGLARRAGKWVLYEVHAEGERITGADVVETSTDFLYLWERFDILSARYLLRQDRRRA